MSGTSTITIPETSLWANRKCLAICTLVSIANMQYGMDSTILASLQAMPGFLKVFGYEDPNMPGTYRIGSTFQQLIGSLLTLGSFLSSLLAGLFAHYLGRRPALWLASLLVIIGCILQITTEDKGVVYAGRVILGAGNGFLSTFSTIYTAEAAPAHLRAVLVGLFSEWVLIGGIVGAAVTYATQTRLDKGSYQIPLGISFIVPVILSVGLLFVPESPRYLLTKGKHAAARKSFEFLRGDALQPEELELEWTEMVMGISEEKQTAQTAGPVDMFRGTNLRRTLLCYGVIATQTGTGSSFVIAYGTYFLLVAGLSLEDAFRYWLMICCIGFVGVNVGMYAMRHLLGRRSILIIGTIVQGLCMLAIGIPGTVAAGTVVARNCLIAFFALYLFAYNGSVGDASYPVATELVSTRLRSWTVGSAISLGYFLAWLTGFCTPYFINPEHLNWGAKYCYIWAGSNFICAIFYYLLLPEMKGRTLEEIDELFTNRVSVKDFKTFKTTIMDEASREVKKGGAAEHVEVCN